MLLLRDISFPRCIKPADAVGNPSLVIFCDGSNDAFGACAYVRWERKNGFYQSYLIASKNRLSVDKKRNETGIRKRIHHHGLTDSSRYDKEGFLRI